MFESPMVSNFSKLYMALSHHSETKIEYLYISYKETNVHFNCEGLFIVCWIFLLQKLMVRMKT